MGRFLTRDIWAGNTNLPLSYNRWNYAHGNPVNSIDPMGLFPIDVIYKNIDNFRHPKYPRWLINGFSSGTMRERYGFLALLLDADNYDYISNGYLQLQKLRPTIGYYSWQPIYLVNCDTIMVGSQMLRDFYETKVKMQREPWIYWRDTSVSYYQLKESTYNDVTTYIDGDYSTDLPSFHSVDLTFGLGNVDLMVDLDGNFYFSIAGGAGEGYGVNYTESYLCFHQDCNLSPSDISNSIKGYCAYGGAQLGLGYGLSICGFLNPFSATAVSTFTAGLGLGITLPGGSVTFPISMIFPQNAEMGWRDAINAHRNGIHSWDIRYSP